MNLFEIEFIWLFLPLLPLVAFMYATVGHGGASGYLALMALFGFSNLVMKPTALLLNLFVSAISFLYFSHRGYFNKRLFIVFSIASVPCAFLGGFIDINAVVYNKILAVLLVFAVLKMLNFVVDERPKSIQLKIWHGIFVGGAIGFFSGLIGIGGGIILSPIILLMGWGNMKETAAVSALFIWVNSASALSGQIMQGARIDTQAFLLVGVAIVGGISGAYSGSTKFNNRFLKYMLAFILSIASLKLFFT